jgi:hypothetical protein
MDGRLIMAQYRKRPVVIEAVQAVAGHMSDLPGVYRNCDLQAWVIRTLEGEMIVTPGDWVITGVKGERYPCKPDIFALTYDPVDG